MKALIVHNPSAGNGEHDKDKLSKIVKKAGYTVTYISTENDSEWDHLDLIETDVIFIAGGDGTVNKLATVMLGKSNNKAVPIHLFPIGTANNIATTLQIPTGLDGHTFDEKRCIKSFDCGKVIRLTEQTFFVESAGFGVFPSLIAEMKRNKKNNDAPSDELKRALEVLLKIVKKYKPRKATIKTDGIKIKGKFLLVELMNIKYLGPNIQIAPHSDPGDGFFELVMIPEKNRKEFEHYIQEVINGKSENLSLGKLVKTIMVQQATLKWEGGNMHIDDNLIDDYSRKKIEIDIIPSALSFCRNV